jgi:hypothetical protein
MSPSDIFQEMEAGFFFSAFIERGRKDIFMFYSPGSSETGAGGCVYWWCVAFVACFAWPPLDHDPTRLELSLPALRSALFQGWLAFTHRVLGQGDRQPGQRIPVALIKEVSRGKRTGLLRSPLAKDAAESRCFAILAEQIDHQCLEVEAESDALAELWITGLTSMLSTKQQQS